MDAPAPYTSPAPSSTLPTTNLDSAPPPRTRSPSPAHSPSSSSSPSPARGRSISPPPTTPPSSSPKSAPESTPNPIIASAPVPTTATDSTPPSPPDQAPDSTQGPPIAPSPSLDSTPAPIVDSAPAPTPTSALAVARDSDSPPTPAPARAPESHSPQPRALDLAPDSTKAPAPESQLHLHQPRALDSTKDTAIDSTPAPAPAPDSTTPGLASATTVAPADVDVEVELAPKKIEEEDNCPSFHCVLCDTEVAYTIAQALLPGLASACVDNTTGSIFKTPASVAVEMRKEMLEYLTQRSETFVAETLILEENLAEEVSDHPYDIVANFVDDFDVLKRNWFSRVSGWLLSERREDRIDDLIQEMELNKFWDIERREAVARNLLKDVDFKNEFHCNAKFKIEHELDEHVPSCRFRTVICSNEGCNVNFMVGHLEQHESVCPFKMILCEQGCSDAMMRREMDKHCITVCRMKLVNCRFYQVGCKSSVPQCKIGNHLSENLHEHVLCVLQSTRKEASVEKLKCLVQQLVESPFRDRLEEANNARALMAVIKDVEAKIEPTEVYEVNVSNGDHAPTAEAKENDTSTD